MDQYTIVKRALKAGCEVVASGRTGHPKLLLPNGAKVTIGASPSDNRAGINLRAQLRRHGLRI